MNMDSESQSSWVDILALILSFLAAILSFGGAAYTYISQAQISATPLWPLPGIVLVDWVLLGTVGFIAAFFSLRKKTVGWMRSTWFLTGALIPILILGAFSIGPMVLIVFLLAAISTFIIAMRLRLKWLESFGLLMLGSISNLLILTLFIIYANSLPG
jgi:hypothetical protein